MGDFIGIIALLVLYVIASSMGKKKKAAENPKSKQKVQNNPSAQQNKKASPKKKTKDSSKPALQNKKSADVYQPITPDFPEIQVQNQDFELHEHEDHDEERQAFARDIMRGVIMNEILTRPSEREAIRRMRQRR